jgi:hypothetical protein
MKAPLQVAEPTAAPQNRLALLKDIRTKWMKFTESELMLLTNTDALVTLVEEKYGREIVQREVNAVLRGRSL